MSDRIGQVLHNHLRFYQLLGLHGLPLTGDVYLARNLWIFRLWAGCLLSGYTTLAFVCLISDDEFLYQGDALGWFNDGLKFVLAEIAICCIYMETMCERYPLACFWQLYAQLAQSTAESVHRELLQHWRFLASLYGTILLEMLLFFLLNILHVFTRHIWLFWMSFQPFVLMVHLRNTQFLLHLELLRQQLVQLERELALLVEYSSFASVAATFTGFDEYMRRRVRQKQLVYGRIHKLSEYFLEAFRFSLLTVLFVIYMRIAVDFYFMYYTIYNHINNFDYYLLLPALLEIPGLIYESHTCMHMVLRIAYQLHRIVVTSPALSVQIQNFSLQLLHQPVRIDCLGMTVLNSALLTRVATAICTYMIFTVQLIPKLSASHT